MEGIDDTKMDRYPTLSNTQFVVQSCVRVIYWILLIKFKRAI